MRSDIVRQAVGTDHGVLERQDTLHVGFIHGEVNRRGRLQFRNGVFDWQAHLFRHLVEIHAGELRISP